MHNINILPPKLRRKRYFKNIGNPRYAPFLFVGVVISILLLGFQLNVKTNQIIQEEELITTKKTEMTQRINETNSTVGEIEKLKKEIELINSGSAMDNENIPWDILLDEISATIPPEVVINNIKENSKGEIEIDAETTKLTHMARTKESFIENPYYDNVEVEYFSQENTTIISRPTIITFKLTFNYIPYPEFKFEENNMTGSYTDNLDDWEERSEED